MVPVSVRTTRRAFITIVSAGFLAALSLGQTTPAEAGAVVPGPVTAWRQSDLTPNQWALAAIGAPRARTSGAGAGVTVATFDTGADATHPDLAGVLVDGATVTSPNGSSFVLTPTPANKTTDKDGHGTHVAGIIAAKDDGHGTTGASPDARIMSINVDGLLGNDKLTTRTFVDGMIAGMTFAANHGARVFSMSLGGDQPEPSSSGTPDDDAVQFARLCSEISTMKKSRNIVTVVAAGNGAIDGNQAHHPGNCADSVGVGATDAVNNNAFFSTYNSSVDIAAPGHQVLSTVPGGDFAMMSGTSMATPYVSAAFADIFSLHPDWTVAQAITAVNSTAHDLGVPGPDVIYGYGLLDIAAATGRGTTVVTPHDTLATNARWATNPAKEGIIGWNAPGTNNVSGYSVTLLNTATGRTTGYDLGADAVQMVASAPMNGRWWIHVVAHRRVGVDLDAGWTNLPYLGNINPKSRPSLLKVTPVRSTASAVTFRMTWKKGADSDLASFVAYGYSTDRTDNGVQVQANPATASAFLTVSRKLLAEDGAFYVWYPLGDENAAPPGTLVRHKGDSGAYVSALAASGAKNVYRVDGVINPSALTQLAPYPGQLVRVQVRNRATRQAVSLTSTRLSVTKDISYNNTGTATKVNWYRFTVWPNVPLRPAQADLRLITVVKGRSVVTAWVPLS